MHILKSQDFDWRKIGIRILLRIKQCSLYHINYRFLMVHATQKWASFARGLGFYAEYNVAMQNQP